MFSGGLDSVGALYLLLTDPQYAQFSIHVHHVNIQNKENRSKAETIAVNNIVNWFKSYNYNFITSQSSIEYCDFDGCIMPDTDITGFFAGYVCSMNHMITKVAYGTNLTDQNPRRSQRTIRSDNIRQCFTNNEKIWPVGNMNKQQIYQILPDDLKTMFWSCRTPIYTTTKIIPCRQCKTCIQLREANITHPIFDLTQPS